MAQKPETKFIARLKKDILQQVPDAYFRKTNHQFVSGLPDLQITVPHKAVAIHCEFEVKWLPTITHHRQVSYRPLQKETLEKLASLGVPCGLIIGSPKGIAWYHGTCLPTHAHIADFWMNSPFNLELFMEAHYGLMSFQQLRSLS